MGLVGMIYIFKRLISVIPVMGIMAFLVFSVLYFAPGDPALLIAGDNATPDDVARIRHDLGLDQPLVPQFMGWLGRVVHGDLGVSVFTKQPVTTMILQRTEPTLSIMIVTLILSVSVAVPLGTMAGARSGGGLDHFLTTFATLGFSVPVFAVAYIYSYVFSVKLGWFPVQGYSPIVNGVWGTFKSITLPCLSLAFAYIALIARVTRASVIDVLSKDYVRTAAAKGLPRFLILTRHVLRNASVPVVTVIGLGVAMLIGGSVVIETVFAIPGIGRLVIDAIVRRDFPVIQGVLLVFSAVYVLINLAVDLSYSVLDPRIDLQ